MLDLEPLLDRVLEQLARLIAYDAAFVATLDGRDADHSRLPQPRAPPRSARARSSTSTRVPPLRALIASRQPFVIADLQQDTAMVAYIESAIAGPRGQSRLDGRAADRAGPRHRRAEPAARSSPASTRRADLQRVQAFANQVALALENARLYERAREAATLEERNRLARELHDAVTQTLFSASLVAEALPEAWHGAPPLAVRGVEHVRVLTRGALAEMRTLLLELRPSALTEKPLGELLQALCTATASRSQVPVEFDVRGHVCAAAGGADRAVPHRAGSAQQRGQARRRAARCG